MDRTVGVGVITREDALAYGIKGPHLRSSGVDLDLRKDSRTSVTKTMTLKCRLVSTAIATIAIRYVQKRFVKVYISFVSV